MLQKLKWTASSDEPAGYSHILMGDIFYSLQLGKLSNISLLLRLCAGWFIDVIILSTWVAIDPITIHLKMIDEEVNKHGSLFVWMWFLDAVFIVYGLKMSRSEVLSSFEERLIWLFMHARKETRLISSHLAPTSLVNKGFTIRHKEQRFSCGIQRAITSGEDSLIRPLGQPIAAHDLVHLTHLQS